jgi:CheY-like chemotaxis protein
MNRPPNVLLVEDDQFKSKALVALLNQEFPILRLAQARSLSSGYRILEGEQFDLLLLDMSLPTFDVGPNDSGGEPLGFGGLKLLDLLHESGLSLPTIVVTQFEQFGEGEEAIDVHSLEISLRESFPAHFVGLVQYNSARADWKLELIELMKDLGGQS